MAERNLSLSQKLTLLPAAIPEQILDFLEDFNYPTPLQTETVQAAIDPAYLKENAELLMAQLLKMREELGEIKDLDVTVAGREFTGAYFVKLVGQKAVRGIGISTRLKERNLLKIVFQFSDFNEDILKNLLKA